MRKLLTAMGMGLLAAAAAQAEWVRLSDAPPPAGNLAFSAAWDPARGLHLKVTDGATNRDVTVEAGRDSLPAPATNALPLVLKFRQESWSLFSQERCLATIPAPFALPAVVWQPLDERPAESARKTGYQKAADFRFEDSYMRPEGEENSLGEWNVESGAWYLHTAKETALEGDFLKPDAKRTPQSDFSPNFYSLAATGTPAVITAGYDFYDNYSFEAGVRTEPGEMGLLFYYQDSGACQGFTVKMNEGSDEARLTLWSAASSNGRPRKVLGAVATTLPPGQWVKLRVKIFQGRVQCFLDQAKAFDVTMDLPAGGRFGLFASGAQEARFDDVSVESNHDLDFRTAADVRRSVLAEEGAFFPRARLFGLLPPNPDAPALAPPASRRAQWLVVGSPEHGPHVFSAEFEQASLPSCVGLLLGWTGSDQPYYRFTANRTGKSETFRLERVSGSEATLLAELVAPLKPGDPNPGKASLMADASGEKEWRFYRNGELVLFQAPAPEAKGASGLYIGPGTKTRLSIPAYTFKRGDLFKNRYEKNNRFAEDPFMKHWASPEGQWIEERNGLTWYTGDFFGRFSLRMPLVEPSEIHLGVAEGETNGEWVVSAHDGALFLQSGADAAARKPPLARAPAVGLETDGTGKWYTVQSEGRWLWVVSGDKLLLKQSLARPIQGRRIRVAGFTVPLLKETYVERFNVKDFLFTESLYDWVVNGGRWEIVNRFQCDPRWSHMNGEGTNGLAALWAKYEIKGDFCVEMHAGQRMGWYDRCGDMNMTVMSSQTSPGQGYSITCTGWDPDSSQLYTTLYRHGVRMARSSQYMVPRKREGNKRLGYEPLLPAGARDVHGAWYYLKFRRIGHTLEFYFDNDLVFSVKDDQPVEGGLAGIWTYMNSIMVARVKVAAEEIRPRPVVFTPVLAAPAPAPAAPAPGAGVLLKDGKPLGLCSPLFWRADDPVSRLVLSWPSEPGAGPSFTARNIAGSGNMLAACSLPPIPLADLAGWRFEVKRSAKAQFNFHYSVGRIGENGAYVAERQFFHRLSGSGLDKGDYSQSGETPVPPGSSWTPVNVWLPSSLAATASDRSRVVRVEGFGNLQPSLEQQGLTGNMPGESYAVREFTEITYSTPKLGLATNGPAPASWAVLDPATGKKRASFATVAALQAWVNAPATGGLIRVSVQGEGSQALPAAPLAWIRLPAHPAVACVWHAKKPDTVALRCVAPYPDRRFLAADLLIGGISPILFDEAFDTRSAVVPRRPELCGERLPVSILGGDVTNTFSLAWKDNPARDVPVLFAFDGVTPFLQNAEPRERLAGLPGANPNRVRVEPFDARQGSYFGVRNTFDEKRLRCTIPVSLSLARYPLFQFRYRTDDEMARVSLSLGNARFVQLSENYAPALPVRYATNLFIDGAWHDWLGQISDAVTSPVYDRNLYQVNSPELGSAHGIDQTGLFSRWDLDDLVFGPAVSTPDQLAFTPSYFDFGGIESVRMTLHAGPVPFSSLASDQAAALAWVGITNAARVVPSLAGLADGPHHLFVKARGRSGKESQVTDIPFLLDRQGSPATAVFGSTDGNPGDHADFRVTVTPQGGAPSLDPDSLKIKWQENEMTGALPEMRLSRQPDRETISFNWAWYFRDKLSKTTNGQKTVISLTGIQDGAGNRSPDVVVPVTIDYQKDRVPPSLMPALFPTNVFWHASWESTTEKNTFFTSKQPVPMDLVRGSNELTYLRVTGGRSALLLASITKPNWTLKDYPYLALRLRRPFLIGTNGASSIQLSLEMSSANTLGLPLIVRRGAPRHFVLPDPIEWRSNEWTSVFVDLEAAMKDRFPTQSLAGLTVKGLSIRQSASEPADQLHIQSVFIYGPGKTTDQARVRAYDASGVDRVVTGYETAAGQAIEAAAFLGSPAISNRPPMGWVVYRVQDKAGNLTPPFHVPAWSQTPPAGDP